MKAAPRAREERGARLRARSGRRRTGEVEDRRVDRDERRSPTTASRQRERHESTHTELCASGGSVCLSTFSIFLENRARPLGRAALSRLSESMRQDFGSMRQVKGFLVITSLQLANLKADIFLAMCDCESQPLQINLAGNTN
jgi:hypothetical protein